VKPQSQAEGRKLNKELFSNPEFEEFWRAISARTTYRVTVDRDRLIEATRQGDQGRAAGHPAASIQVTRAGVKILRGGTKATEKAQRSASSRAPTTCPTSSPSCRKPPRSRARRSSTSSLDSGRLPEFIGNPNDFIADGQGSPAGVLARSSPRASSTRRSAATSTSCASCRRMVQEEKDRFLDQMSTKVQTQVQDRLRLCRLRLNDPERQFAEKLDGRDDIKFFMKLPDKFKIDTPVGPYNPDWAIIKHEDGADRIYMIRETKSTLDEVKRRPTENAKIKAATKHFKQLGIGTETVPGYAVSAPGSWNL
jgi:type III restriction enzyme